MNLFKGLLYLIDNDQPASSWLTDAPHYGAATAAGEFAGELGNGAASRQRFGARPMAPVVGEEACFAGGCA
jgi:hypothetical protein